MGARHCTGCMGYDESREDRQCQGAAGETSDGYHTFDELYDHRVTLFIALCAALASRLAHGAIWRSKLHSDGSAFDGWFVMGLGVAAGEQVTYHLPLARWSETDDIAVNRDRAPEFDGHTSVDVLVRLRQLYTVPHKPTSGTQGKSITRPMMRCKTCRTWWSGEPFTGPTGASTGQRCACGGELELADLVAYAKTIPYVPFDHAKEAASKKTK